MRTEAGAIGRRIGLDCVSFIEQTLVINLLQKVPEGLYITIVVGDIRIVHIDPVAYPLCHIHPLCGIFHDLLTAGRIIFLDRYLGADISLRNPKFLLNTEFDRKTMGIPSGTAAYFEAGLSLVTADSILY